MRIGQDSGGFADATGPVDDFRRIGGNDKDSAETTGFDELGLFDGAFGFHRGAGDGGRQAQAERPFGGGAARGEQNGGEWSFRISVLAPQSNLLHSPASVGNCQGPFLTFLEAQQPGASDRRIKRRYRYLFRRGVGASSAVNIEMTSQ